MGVSPKVMSSILLCWTATPEKDSGGMASELEPSCQ